MLPWVPAPLVIAAQIIATIAFYAAARWTGAVRAMAFGLAFAVVILAPLAVAPDRREVRLGIALVAAWMSSKLYDLFFGVPPDERPSFSASVGYVFNRFWMVHRSPGALDSSRTLPLSPALSPEYRKRESE